MEYEVSKVNLKAAEQAMNYTTPEDLESSIRKVRKDMEEASKTLDFIEAARLRDLLIELEDKGETLSLLFYVILGMGLLFFGLGFMITENNTDSLLSGYNTMSKEEQNCFL